MKSSCPSGPDQGRLTQRGKTVTLEEYHELKVGDKVKILTLAEREGTITKTRSLADGWAMVDMGTFSLNVNYQEMTRASAQGS